MTLSWYLLPWLLLAAGLGLAARLLAGPRPHRAASPGGPPWPAGPEGQAWPLTTLAGVALALAVLLLLWAARPEAGTGVAILLLLVLVVVLLHIARRGHLPDADAP